MLNNPVINAAVGRAFVVSLLVGILTVLTTRQLNVDIGGLSVHPSWEDSGISGAVAFITGFLARGFGEGGYDAQRAANNNVNKGDVPVAAPDVVVTEPPKP